jgi:hypothetical protein
MNAGQQNRSRNCSWGKGRVVFDERRYEDSNIRAAHERARITTLHWAPTRSGLFAEATVPGMLMNMASVVKNRKRFADCGGWRNPVLDFDTAFGMFKLRTSARATLQRIRCAALIGIDTFVQLVFLARRGLIASVKGSTSNSNCKSTFGDLTAAAERELGAFLNAVTDLYGADQARLAAEDWILELETMDLVPELSPSVWRTLTIGSASRLAERLNTASDDTKVSPIRSSNCSVREPLA